jgi:hypothetical protein
MSREVKRVAVDFQWETGKGWPGYINPYLDTDCPVCGGDDEDCSYGKFSDEYCFCIHPSFYDVCHNWERIEPPEGKGYQLWETVSEGSPVSPVFLSVDGLIEWMMKNQYSQWAIQWIKDGKTYLPSGMGFGNQLSFVQDYD